MNPSHTHRQHGGRFGQVTTYWGSGPLEGQQLVVYQDLDRVTESLTTMEDWQQNWREIDTDDCPVCLGTGTDQIKGNKGNPCGGCFGLGKVRQDGETPADRWQVADIALGIIRHQQHELERRRQAMASPEVREAMQAARERGQAETIARQENEWRNSPGHGPGGQRYTGD